LPAESHGIQELLRGQSIVAFPSDDTNLCTGVTLYGDHVASQDAITIKTVNESRVRYVP